MDSYAMNSYALPETAVIGIGAVVALALTLRGVVSLVARVLCGATSRTPWGLATGVYEDEDGASTANDVKKFSNAAPRAYQLSFALLGAVCSAVVAAAGAFNGTGLDRIVVLEDVMVLCVWTIIALHAFSIFTTTHPPTAYSLGLVQFFALLTLCLLLFFQLTVRSAALSSSPALLLVLRLVSAFSSVAALIASISLPRRPDVFLDSRPVDRQDTISAVDKYTWGRPWIAALVDTAGRKGDLTLDDLPRPGHEMRARNRVQALRQLHETMSHRPWWVALILGYKKTLFFQGFLCIVRAVLAMMPSVVTWRLLGALEASPDRRPEGLYIWCLVVWLGAAVFGGRWAKQMLAWTSWGQLSLMVRAQISALLFEKLMRRQNTTAARRRPKVVIDEVTGAMSEEPVAEEDDAELLKKPSLALTTLVGVDVRRISLFAGVQFNFWTCLVQFVLSMFFLYRLIGFWPSLAGLIGWCIVIPINIFFAKKNSKAQSKWMKIRDGKLALVTEALQCIRQIKFSALEDDWEDKILGVRETELSALWECFRIDTLVYGCWVAGPIAMTAASLATYAWLNGELTPSVAFVSIVIFKDLEATLSVLPTLVKSVVEVSVSIKRISEYLAGPEMPTRSTPTATSTDGTISLADATLAWPTDGQADISDRFVLQKVNLSFPSGSLSVVSGKTGSGKSLLLSAILGEAEILDGSVQVPRKPSLDSRRDHLANAQNWIVDGAVAFVSQTPWIENASFRDNVLFGLPLDERRYRDTIYACALDSDLEHLVDGDQTELGANGVNLSGGQKWRLTLARAVYSRASILVLDDIFSAVDAPVGRHILDKCLTGPLCRNRTRIVVTHHVGLCEPKASLVVELAGNRVKSARRFENRHDVDDMESWIENAPASTELPGPRPKAIRRRRTARKFIEDEKRAKGSVKASVYATYFGSGGNTLWWTVAAALFLAFQGVLIGRSWWLKLWTSSYEEHTSEKSVASLIHDNFDQHVASASPSHGLAFYLSVYLVLSVVGVLVGTLRFLYMFHTSLRTSRNLFSKLTRTILRTPLRWIDTVPLGRIINRFTADFNTVDGEMAAHVTLFAHNSLSVVGVCVAAWFVSPYLILLALGVVGITISLGVWYLGGARPMKRLESTSRSPVFELFMSALGGSSTIRAFGRAPAFVDRIYDRLDSYTSASWYLWVLNQRLAFMTGFIGTMFVTLVAAAVVMTPSMDAALAGFAIAFALEFSLASMWAVRQFADIELDMNAVERIVEYADVETEVIGGREPPAAWPARGHVKFEEVEVGYGHDLPAVLKGISFEAKPGERIGVVGRTGAGKSSLALSLFRFLECRQGRIVIDGLDISKLDLHHLRSRLAIIPQDPILFSGTVRSNLDPFDDHSDSDLHEALERVHLSFELPPSSSSLSSPTHLAFPSPPPSRPLTPIKGANTHTPFGDLSTPISEGGANLSQGQRQLLALARAILARPHILVLDEATSAVDMATDAALQTAIRKDFGGCTMIVVAHRLSTVADFDRILVLDQGEVREFGTPEDLWVAGGVFRDMCERSGEREVLRRTICG